MKKEGNKYDKILKEGIEDSFLALSKQFLGFEIKNYKKLTPKLQTTLEKEVDFLALVETVVGKEFILHLEFQTENDPNMLYRMAEYHGVLFKKYRKPIKAVVLYLGNSKVTMQTKLADSEVFTGFELLDVREWSYQKILELDSVEAMVWAILANFENEPQEKVLRSILERVKELSKHTTTSQKFVKQLLMFSQLRKLDTSLQKIVDTMPITIDLRENAVIKAAIAKEIEKLRKAYAKEFEQKQQQAIEKEKERIEKEKQRIEKEKERIEKEKQRIEKEKHQAIQKMLLVGSLSLEQIADFMSCSVEDVKKIQTKMKL